MTGFGGLGTAVIVLALACRVVLQLQVDHTLRVSPIRGWLGPARDLLAFAVYVASFVVDVVSWRGQRYKISANGTLAPIGDPKP